MRHGRQSGVKSVFEKKTRSDLHSEMLFSGRSEKDCNTFVLRKNHASRQLTFGVFCGILSVKKNVRMEDLGYDDGRNDQTCRKRGLSRCGRAARPRNETFHLRGISFLGAGNE